MFTSKSFRLDHDELKLGTEKRDILRIYGEVQLLIGVMSRLLPKATERQATRQSLWRSCPRIGSDGHGFNSKGCFHGSGQSRIQGWSLWEV